jgi:NAD(P)-dependent dehydrogenase (short-subunit alcohol dehydrogenase family)
MKRPAIVISEEARAFHPADRFTGASIIVTGAGRGIGRAICFAFAREGGRVLLSDIDLSRAEGAAAEIGDSGGTCEACQCDVTDADSVRRMVHRAVGAYGGVDVLVNNAAVATDVAFEDVSESEWDHDVGVSLKGPFLCCQAALPYLLRSVGGGTIVNVGSVNGLAAIGSEAYSAGKAGLISLTQNLAVRYGPEHIRANIVCAGTVRSAAWNERLAIDPEVLFERLARFYPLRRVGEPEEIAAACLFLASSEAAWITGSVLCVDGGLTAGRPLLIDAILKTGGGSG